MKPKYTLRQIYGENAVYTPRTPFSDNPWMMDDPHKLDALTSREVAIADIPVLVHRATQTEKAQELHQLTGLPWVEQPFSYDTQEEYLAHIRSWCEDDKTIVCQYIHDLEHMDRQCYWMDAEKFNELNSKAYIDHLIDSKFVPSRLNVETYRLSDAIKNWQPPVVLKPGDDSPTSGGYGVIICHNKEELTEGLRQFRMTGTESIIIEELLQTKDNYSCQFVYSEELGIQYLGASQQITDENGIYHGNIIVDEVPEKVIEVGRHIMEQGVAEGFVGVAGFDLIVTEAGDVQAIDLNFRQNGSTSMLMFHDTLGKPINKFASYVAQSPQENEVFFQTIKKFVEQKILFPLSFYDGNYFDEPVPSRFVGIWYADQLSEIEKLEQELL
ncbi:L-aspartate--L-methionine ligase LdmS [Lysinibacillus fusiformis]|uniref:ATP-grasp domain-containing protein n=1 Tax=Lysinibacillus fusiformis TaxID=28031 RepID=A0A1E4R236_9BACI|nr:ATP-grasp domain-containing protein [Lysinibacillus fusiformis]ODV54542.1 ATP-grasp domain-containing protein [Lysinibacillus fusiformis]